MAGYMMAARDSTYTEVGKSIARGAMIFLETPYRGSENAAKLHAILSATIGSKQFVEELKREYMSISAINKDFRHYVKDVCLWSLYENRPTSIGAGRSAVLVDRDTAVLGYDNEGFSRIEGDHRTICKFESREAPGYKTIKDLLAIPAPDSAPLDDGHPPGYTVESGARHASINRRPNLAAKQLSKILGQDDTSGEHSLFFRDNRVVADSCQWIFEKSSFKWWADRKSTRPGRYLWLYGPPAAGKSVLVSAVIDKSHSEHMLTAFYFFRRNNVTGRMTRSFLLSLIAQMSMHSLEFYEKLMDIDAQQAKIHSMPTRVLWQKIFIDTLFEVKSSTESQWYWIIDALDEADMPSELISLIGRISSQTPINMLITSRVDMDIKRSLQTSVPKQALHQQEIEPADTKDDMAAHARHELESLPFEPNEISQIVELLVAKSQGIFLWVRFAVEEIQATAHTLQGVYEALEAMPSEMANFFQQILDGMSAMRETNKKIAKAILGSTVCAMRPLGTLELQAALHPTFGRLASLDYTIKQVCPLLIKVDQDSGIVQLIHGTVREFLLQCQDSEFSVDSLQAHHHLTRICLGVWTEDTFASPISSSLQHTRSVAELNAIHPLLYYSATSWFDHLQNAAIDKPLELAICDFLRTSVLSWVEVAGLLGDLSLLTAGALGLETLMVQSPLISNANKRLVSGWAVDLVRIAPQYGRNIVSYPFSIHKLLPPFCPVKTQIGSQFGAAGDISIVGAGHKHWDDFLAHITVARDGGLCKFLVCGATYLVVALSGSTGTAIVYDAETCQELRRFSHGERIVALHINSTGEYIVTGGLRSMETWRTKTGEMVSELANPGRSRCLGAAFRPDSKCVVIFTSNDSIAIWDLRQNSATESRLERQSVHGKYRGWPWGVAFDKDATKVSLAYKGWPIEVWHVDRVEIVESVPTRNPLGSCFNPSSNDIYVVDHDSTMIRYDIQAQTTTQIRLNVRVAVCNPCGTLLVTGDSSGVLKFFAADTMELLYKIDKYSDMITGLCFSPDGTKLYDIRASDCNAWIPEVLLVSVREDSSLSGVDPEKSTLSRTGCNITGDSSSLVNITSLICDSTGSFVCCGKSNGDVLLYHTQSGRVLQQLYTHGSTFDVQVLEWSADGSTLVSIDSSQRFIVSRLKQISTTKWNCERQQDFYPGQSNNGAVRQLLLSPDSTRLLASFRGAHSFFDLNTGQETLQTAFDHPENLPIWLQHPHLPEQLICLDLQVARIFRWDTGPRKSVKTLAYLTHDKRSVVVEWSTLERNPVTKCSTWSSLGFDTTAELIQESNNWHHLRLDSVVGVYRNQAVFLDQDLWVCSSPCGKKTGTTRHFYMPMDWLNTSEERLAVMTRSGEFVYAQRGVIVVVKCGMRSNQGLV
ncbi:hypothetical protein BB8028_0008g01560 [Beauveria bassiana]|uniref:Vegetative incompatibility protein HET-E-1 n=1 Tax=Beauveria bassiana TaxID=176275 RepID=A0A2S7YNL3_BEABA|nr:hypothetical protein BB8028_0008g01560 [Beauveria bassiana]